MDGLRIDRLDLRIVSAGSEAADSEGADDER
jgi:hypothetical protein